MQLNQMRGFALLEALIALAIVCAGVLTLLWGLQQATLTQQHNLRWSSAYRHAHDWMARVQINPSAINLYTHDWHRRESSNSGPSSALVHCEKQFCSSAELALWDQVQWWQSLAQEIPQAQAQFLRINPALAIWRLTIAWPDLHSRETPGCPAQSQCLHLEFTPHP